MGFKPDLFVTDAMFFSLTQMTGHIRRPLKEVKVRTKICRFDGIQTRPLYYWYDVLLIYSGDLLLRGPLKKRWKRGPISVALMGFKPDLFVTDAMFLLTQVTGHIRRPLKKEVKVRTKICGFDGIQTRPLCYWCNVLLTHLGDRLYEGAAEREVKVRTKILRLRWDSNPTSVLLIRCSPYLFRWRVIEGAAEREVKVRTKILRLRWDSNPTSVLLIRCSPYLFRWRVIKGATEKEVKARTNFCGFDGIQTRPLCYWCNVLLTHSGDRLYEGAAERELKVRTKVCGFDGIQTRPLCYWCNVLLTHSGDRSYKAATKEVKVRTKICGFDGIQTRPLYYWYDVLLIYSGDLLLRGPLKKRWKRGPISVALMGFKPDLFVTDAMFFLLTQVTGYMRGPLKER